jgi:uncharacterized protein YjbJ (UPF0337 family)
MEIVMIWDRVEGYWKEVQGQAKQQWVNSPMVI